MPLRSDTFIAFSRSKSDIPATILLGFCSEGDNTKEAIDLARMYNEWTEEVPRADFKIPVSWKHLFGNAPPPSIY